MLPGLQLQGQVFLGGGYQHGYNLPLYDRSPETTRSSPFVHFSLLYESDGRFPVWEYFYNKPSLRLQLGYQDLGNPKEQGGAFVFLPDFKFNIKRWERSSLVWGGGLGVGYATRPFDKRTNPRNEALGTHWNIYAQLHLNYEVKLKSDWFLSFDFDLHHLSNSFVAFPNLGVNIPSAGVSVYKVWRSSDISNTEGEIGIPDNVVRKTPWRPFVRLIYGITERGYDGPKFGVPGVGLGMSKKWKGHRMISLGGEYLFDASRYHFLVHASGQETNKEFVDASRFLLFAGHEYLMRNVSFVAELGVYVTNQYDRQSIISAKAGINFYPWNTFTRWKNQISIGAFIRAYFLRADFFEVSFNYRL